MVEFQMREPARQPAQLDSCCCCCCGICCSKPAKVAATTTTTAAAAVVKREREQWQWQWLYIKEQQQRYSMDAAAYSRIRDYVSRFWVYNFTSTIAISSEFYSTLFLFCHIKFTIFFSHSLNVLFFSTLLVCYVELCLAILWCCSLFILSLTALSPSLSRLSHLNREKGEPELFLI